MELRTIQFEVFKKYPEVRYGAFLRGGGYSTGPYCSLNLSTSTGDNSECVEKNRALVAKAIGASTMTFARLIHGKQGERVTFKNRETLPPCDALFTTEKQLPIAVTFADCQAAIFYDPINRAFAVVHAGWRGLMQNIYQNVCLRFQREFNTDPADLIVGISPSLGPEYAEYKNFRDEFPKKYWSFQKEPNFFDFRSLAKIQLKEEGILEENIEISSLCTYKNEEICFSHRRDKLTGRHALVAFLENS